MQNNLFDQPNANLTVKSKWFITAGNEVGARLCFYTCMWFCSHGVRSRSLSWGGLHLGGLHPRGSPSWGISVPGGLCPRGLCLRGSLSQGVSPGGASLSGGLCPGRSLSRGVSVQGVSVMETPRMVMSGRYASYWNAFLLELVIVNLPSIYFYIGDTNFCCKRKQSI